MLWCYEVAMCSTGCGFGGRHSTVEGRIDTGKNGGSTGKEGVNRGCGEAFAVLFFALKHQQLPG